MSICHSQNDFNVAFEKAVKYTNNNYNRKLSPIQILTALVYVIIIVWALLLAMSVKDPNVKVIHLVFALIFPPVYIISYYVGIAGK